MACLDMYNSSPPPQPPPPISPRISFSNDFVESHNSQHLLKSRSETPASTDFEFSVTNHNMLTADELFFKGKLLPFRDSNNGSKNQMQRTLRDELLVEDEDIDIQFSAKPPKSASSASSSNRWKGFLGLTKSHIGSRKPEKVEGSSDAAKIFAFVPQDANLTQPPQDMVNNEGSSSTGMEI